MSFTRAELARMSPANLLRLESVLEQVVQDQEAGRVGWLCSVPGCNGDPHPGRPAHHARRTQRPPEGEWDVWLALAGRGWGKTRVGAEWSLMQARNLQRGALIGPTAADTRDILVQGESGILACAPATFRPVYEPSKRRLTYPNGAIQMCYSADEPDRLRGPQHHYGWFDELAAWRYLQNAWDMAQLGMRLGEHPQICVTTTPRPLPLIKQLLKDPMTAVVRGSTYDNLDNLAPTFRRAVIAKYEGTTLGRQELDAEVLEDLPGALVARRHIDGSRVTAAPELVNIVVGMDPAGTGAGDETGLVVVARGVDGKNYVLHDGSERLSPNDAANRAWGLLEAWSASLLVVEDNGGKDWIEAVLKAVWKEREPNGGPPPLRRVNASQGKRLRAQPVAMRYEQGRVCHVGNFPELEDQLCVAEGTLIETDRGHVPVEQVRASDKVMTRGGWAPVVWAGQTGETSRLVGIQVVDCIVWTTEAHPVWDESQARFVRADSVDTASRLNVRPSPASTAIRSPGTAAGGTLRPTATTDTRAASCCTGPSGLPITEPFPQVTLSTTRTTTSGTTRSKTFTWSPTESTGLNIPSPEDHSRRAPSNAVSAVAQSGPPGNPGTGSVNTAGQPSKAQVSGPGTAGSPAGERRTTRVYNLMVADGHLPEYYANGVLVHNCTWIPEEDPNSPDRLDAMVHGIAHLMKRHDRAESILSSPHTLKRVGGGEHPAIAARRRAAERRAS